ncbi:MAG: DUF72 domain-containing protein [Candidatus Sumerlaeia bacterium]
MPQPDIPNTPRYWIGTAGWSYDDWKGIFYPQSMPRGETPLRWYSRFFNLVEIDATFYRVMPPTLADKWCAQVDQNSDFRFSLKLWKGLTHEQPKTLPRKEIDSIRDMCQRFADQGKLAALLMQFPWSFRNNDTNRGQISQLIDIFGGLPCAIEIRHNSWNNRAFFDFLTSRNCAFCNIDQPLLSDGIPLTDICTSEFGYLRLHGRNYSNWFGNNAKASDRYDYLYSRQELDEVEATLDSLGKQVQDLIVVANNHYRGQAPANALQIMSDMFHRPPVAPSCLLQNYPQVQAKPFQAKTGDSAQLDIFDQEGL